MAMFDPTMTMNSSSPDFSAQRSQFIAGCTGFAAGATVAVVLRLFARWKNSTRLAADDLAIGLSLAPLWTLVGTGIAMATQGGLAQQQDTLSPAQMNIFFPAAFASYILYALAITGAKLSILLLYRRIFPSRPFRRTLYAVMAVCIVWCILVVLLAIFRCQPIPAAWNPAYSATFCINLRPLYYGTSTSNVFLDIVVNLLPARQIWGLQLPVKQRVLLVICMCLGIFSIGAGIGRILTVPSLVAGNLPATIAMPFLFVVIEPALAIICACLPTYRPLALWIAAGVKRSRAGSRIKSFIGSSSARSGGSTSRRSGASALFGRWKPSMSTGEKEVFSSASSTPNTTANNTPDLRKEVEGRGFDNHWSKPQMGTSTVVFGGREAAGLKSVPEI